MRLTDIRQTLPSRFSVALVVIALVASAVDARAGLLVTGGRGITTTSAAGVAYAGTSGFAASPVDGLLAFGPNGVSAPFTNGFVGTGPDAVTFAGTNGIAATGVDGIAATHADGIAATGVDGMTVQAPDGTVYAADAVAIVAPSGIAATGVDGLVARGFDGLTELTSANFLLARADGIAATGVDGVAVTHADGVVLTLADGTTVTYGSGAVTISGADTVTSTYVEDIEVTGADEYHLLDLGGLPVVGGLGLQSVDAELALLLDRVTDDSGVNAVIVYHRRPTSSDLSDLRRNGVWGGTIFKALPIVVVTATKRQLLAISKLPAVRSLYGVRTLALSADPSRETTGVTRAWSDPDVTSRLGRSVTGRGVTVAVIDTGLNALHPDVAGRVARNVKLADLGGIPLLGFQYPLNVEGLPNTDLVNGHGTFVAGVVAGSGAASGGRYKGVAPGAKILALGAGDLALLHVLAGFDYVLDRGRDLNVRVVNCSFSAATVFDVNDPVNIATRMLTDAGVSVVFSAGNTGPGWNSLNPYAMAPWVIGVGATDAAGRLAGFSSRGSFGSTLFRPKLVAPGVSVVSLRSSPLLSVVGTLGIESGEDLRNLTLAELPYYTTSSGTSFSAPQVAGTIALMLEANPALTPAQISDILQRTATPMPSAFQHEAGAGMLNAHAAVLEAAFSARRFGAFRAALDTGRVSFVQDPVRTSTRSAVPGQVDAWSVHIPNDTARASLSISWGPVVTLNDLGLTVADPSGSRRATSNAINLLGLTGRRERVTIESPSAGAWRAEVRHSLLSTSAQTYTSALEVSRVTYAPILDLGGLSAAQRASVYWAIRAFAMAPYGTHFRPDHPATRSELAASLVRTGAIPQYLAAAPVFPDARDLGTRLAVESAYHAPVGSLFPDASLAEPFYPNGAADRLTAAIVLVRAAGLGAEAERRAAEILTVSDADAIAPALRGYVAVALEHGLLDPRGGAFAPASPLSRIELARALEGLAGVVAGP